MLFPNIRIVLWYHLLFVEGLCFNYRLASLGKVQIDHSAQTWEDGGNTIKSNDALVYYFVID